MRRVCFGGHTHNTGKPPHRARHVRQRNDTHTHTRMRTHGPPAYTTWHLSARALMCAWKRVYFESPARARPKCHTAFIPHIFPYILRHVRAHASEQAHTHETTLRFLLKISHTLTRVALLCCCIMTHSTRPAKFPWVTAHFTPEVGGGEGVAGSPMCFGCETLRARSAGRGVLSLDYACGLWHLPKTTFNFAAAQSRTHRRHSTNTTRNIIGFSINGQRTNLQRRMCVCVFAIIRSPRRVVPGAPIHRA